LGLAQDRCTHVDLIGAYMSDMRGVGADLFDLCSARHPGRQSADQITMYKNVGGGHLDMFAARHLIRRA
jgi:ornithine cyclodeaminase/alanine dehydrogenase-like protein (mu-crystallin family)